VTFEEINNMLNEVRFQKAILTYLVSHLDTNFMPANGGPPEKVILTDDKVKVPEAALELVISNLSSWLANCEGQEKAILAYPLVIEQKPQVPQEQPVTPTTEAQP